VSKCRSSGCSSRTNGS